MKKVGKLILLVLAVALVCSAVFAVASSAAEDAPRYWYDEDLSASVNGATRVHRDFTGEVFDIHYILDGTNKPSVQTTVAPQNLFNNLSSKTGHLQSITDSFGNTYAKYSVHADRSGQQYGTEKDDAVVGLHPNHPDGEFVVTNLSYLTYEFDMMSSTDFPSNIRIFFETRRYQGKTEYSKSFRKTQHVAIYNKSGNAWNFGGKSLSLDVGEWAHISVVLQIKKEADANGNLNFKDSVAVTYVNGEYMGKTTDIFNKDSTPADVNAVIQYFGIGYAYSDSHNGTKAEDSISFDNLVYTTYSADNERLATLFEENPVNNITGFGPEFVWTTDYELPETSGSFEIMNEDKTIYGTADGITTLSSAMAFIKENELAKVTLKLYGNQYKPLYIDFPVELTIDYNGYELLNGYEVSTEFAADFDVQTSTLKVSDDPTRRVTVNYYDLPKGEATKPTLVQQFGAGHAIESKIDEIRARSIVNGKHVYAPLTTYKVYDEEGNEYDAIPETADANIIGKTLSVYFDYDIKEFANDIKFSVSVDGKVTYYHESNDLWTAGVKEVVTSTVTETTDSSGVVTKKWTETQYPNAIPANATITLYADCTASAPLFTNEENLYIDLNGYTLTATTQFFKANARYTIKTYTQKGDKSPTSSGTSGYYVKNNKAFVYSSAEGAEMVTKDVLVHAKGGITPSNGVSYYFGYRDEDTFSENRIKITFGEKILHLSKGDLRNVYVAQADLYNTVYSETGLISAQDCLGLDVYFTDVNLFTKSPITGSTSKDGTKTVTFVRTNVYAEGGIKMNYVNPQSSTKGSTVYYLTDSKIYGMSYGMTTGDAEMGSNTQCPLIVYLTDKTSRLSDTHPTDVQLKDVEGFLVEKPETVTIDGVTYETIWGVDDHLVISADELKASAFQNMTLETNIVVNLYVPALEDVVSAKIGNQEILDRAKTTSIEGALYYVLSFGVAPKNGNQMATVTVTLSNQTAVDFEMSVERYARDLLSMDATGSAYIADSQELMKYILNYIKEVAVKYGDADEALYADLLDGFTVGTVEIAEPVRDLGAIKTYVTHAALDLDAYAGFAFKVAEGFVGTVKLALAGVNSAEYTYTDRNPATANTVILLENVPVHLFRGDIVITVTPVGGETVEASFNLATYAARFNEAYVKALYAYSLKAEEYNENYPKASTLD